MRYVLGVVAVGVLGLAAVVLTCPTAALAQDGAAQDRAAPTQDRGAPDDGPLAPDDDPLAPDDDPLPDAGVVALIGTLVSGLGIGLEVGLFNAGTGGDEYTFGVFWAPALVAVGTTIVTLAVAWLLGLSLEESAFLTGIVALVASASLAIVAGVAGQEPGGILGNAEDARYNRGFLLASTAAAYGAMGITCFVIPFL